MADVLMSSTQSGPTYLSRSRALARIAFIDVVFHQLTRLSAITVLVILGGVIVSLIHGAQPAIKAFGFGFLAAQSWNPVTENFGAGPAVYGTLVTSLVAMLIAVPIGLGVATFLTELCPHILRRPIGIAIELLEIGRAHV